MSHLANPRYRFSPPLPGADESDAIPIHASVPNSRSSGSSKPGSWGQVSVSPLDSSLATSKARAPGLERRKARTASTAVSILVALRDGSLERVVDLGDELARAAGRGVDIVRLADAEAEPSLLAEIVAEGRVLVDRDELWPHLRSREAELRQRGREHERRRTQTALAGIDRPQRS